MNPDIGTFDMTDAYPETRDWSKPMDKDTVKLIVHEAMQIGNSPGAMCRAAIYLTLANNADTHNMMLLYREMAHRANSGTGIDLSGGRDA